MNKLPFFRQSIKSILNLYLRVYQMNESEESPRLAESSFIHDRQSSIFIRILRIVDIFSFLPFPKDQAVSTKRSITGSILLFALFFTYIIYDFVTFVYNNPPIEQLYRSSLDDKQYTIPQFSIAFMTDPLNNYTETYDGLFTYQMQNITKSQGTEKNGTIPFVVADRTTNNLDWMSDSTKNFYFIQRYPIVEMKAQGLLYSSDTNTYIRTKISYCQNTTNSSNCVSSDTMYNLSSYGRLFLFIKNDIDTSVISKETLASNGNNYLLYNFFVIPGFYKRVNINFQVVQTTILPDYFNEFTQRVTTRLQIQSIIEQLSVVNYNATNTDAIAFNMQLSPTKIINRVSRSTIIDHLSLWGAFWGVLFAAFGLIFLSYNRSKFYKKNPGWDKFKKALQQQHEHPSL